MDREPCKAQVQEQVGYIAFTEHDREAVDELVELITDVLCSTQATFRIGGTQFKSEIVKPNIMQANASYIVTDPKGELARSTIPLLLKKGYTVRVIDLIDPAHSDFYNLDFVFTSLDEIEIVEMEESD